jgi:hypothetical protein
MMTVIVVAERILLGAAGEEFYDYCIYRSTGESQQQRVA